MFGKRRFTHLGLALLLGGVGACNQQQRQQQQDPGVDFDALGFDGFDETHFNLLTTDCSFDGTTGAMTLTLNGGETALLYKRSSDGMVVANAKIAGADCAVASNKKLFVNSHSLSAVDDQVVIIDYYSGAFGLATAASGTGDAGVAASGPMIVIDLGAGNDTVKIRGTSYAETYTFGSNAAGTISYAGFTIGTATARPMADMSMAGVENITVSTGPGADVITGQGGAALGTGTVNGGASSSTSAGPLSGAISFSAYGGDDNDTITSGATSSPGVHNMLSGGAGNDLFPQLAGVLASDQIFGGAGVDTVDYSARTSAIHVTVGTGQAVKASGTIVLPAPSAIQDNDSITLSDGTSTDGGAVTKTILYQASAGAAYATGTITCPDPSLIADNDYFTITDGASNSLSVQYSVSGTFGTAPAGNVVQVDVSASGLTATDVASLTLAAINSNGAVDGGSGLHMTITNPSAGVLHFVNTDYVPGVAIVDGTTHATDAGVGFNIVGMTGGAVSIVPGANQVLINVHSMLTAANVAAATYSAIVAANLAITATAPTSATVSLTCNVGGATGCGATPITLTQSGTAFSKTWTAGGATIAYDDGQWGTTATAEGDSIQNDVENILGTPGNDTIDFSNGGNGTHVIMGMDGDDTLIGGGGIDYIYGGKGNDVLKGGVGADFLYGGDGDDTLEGGADNDHIDGGGVNCIATASAATSTTPPIVPTIGSCSSTAATSSSIGVNTLDYSDHTTAVTVDLTAFTCSGTSVTVGSTGECDILATSTTGSGSSAVTSANVRNIRGGSGNDTLTGDANDNTIWGGEGDDHINGGLGNDNLYGEGGNDTIHGYGTGSGFALTSLSGSQTDTDYVSGGPGTNVLYGDLGLNTIDSTQGWGDTVDCGPNDGNIWLSSGSTGETGTGCQL